MASKGAVDTEDALKDRIVKRMLTLETAHVYEDNAWVCKVKGITRGGATIDIEADSWEAAYRKLPDWLRPE